MKTGNTGGDDCQLRRHAQPQWSPVMKTGNTAFESQLFMIVGLASMEPGHEDREYLSRATPPSSQSRSLNGARS